MAKAISAVRSDAIFKAICVNTPSQLDSLNSDLLSRALEAHSEEIRKSHRYGSGSYMTDPVYDDIEDAEDAAKQSFKPRIYFSTVR